MLSTEPGQVSAFLCYIHNGLEYTVAIAYSIYIITIGEDPYIHIHIQYGSLTG